MNCFLRLACNDKQSRFEEIMDIDSSLSIHHRNTQTLATEIYKVKKSSSLEIMNEIFQLKEDNHYTARQVSQFIVTA